MNQRSFDEESVKNSQNLKELCMNYYSRYAKFFIKGYDHLI